MDEKERLDIDETSETAPVPAEQEAEGQAADEMDADGLHEEDDEEKEPLYLGRFTAGVWRGGILGIAFGYILQGLLGMANKRFSLGMDAVLESPVFRYGLLICLCYGLGKLGGVWEKRAKAEEQQNG